MDRVMDWFGQKAQPESEYERVARSKIFGQATILFILAPICGEFAAYLIKGQIHPSFASSATMVVATVLNYLWFRRSRKLEMALAVGSTLQVFCFFWGIVVSGGLLAEHILYLPVFPVMHGFVFGRKGALASAVSVGLFCLFLLSANRFGVLPLPVDGVSVNLQGYNAFVASLIASTFIHIFSRIRADTTRSLFESKNYINVVLNSIHHGVWGVDLSGRVTFINKQAIALLGYAADTELVGQSIHERVHSAGSGESGAPTQVCQICESSMATSNYRGIEDVLLKRDGTRIPVSYTSSPIWISGRCVGSVFAFEDMTETKKLEQALNAERSFSVHQAKLASLGEMSAGIAHEINNPLAIITGSVGLLSKSVGDPEKFFSRIEMIKKSCDRIVKIISGLKKFSRSGERSVRQRISLCAISKEVLVLTDFKSKRYETKIELEFTSDFKISCNEVEIEQVLVNLVNNAIDAVKDLSERWVRIRIFEQASQVVLQVTDSGRGIPRELRGRLFDPFFTTKRVGEGTGLGLSISKGILDEHNASIAILENSPNTCFELRFGLEEDLKNAA